MAVFHSWDLTPTEAVALQRQLAGQVDTLTPLPRWNLVAGADVSYNRFSPDFYAVVVVLKADTLEVVETAKAFRQTPFPYVPGLLSFREAPVVLDAFSRLKTRPDVLMVDGQGVAHPRRFGIASHLGLWLDLPTIGCAKSLLCGTVGKLAKRQAALAPIKDHEEMVGYAVRTRNGVKPVYVSVGHKIDLPSAVRVVLASGSGFRIPEPTRRAHQFVNDLRREGRKG